MSNIPTVYVVLWPDDPTRLAVFATLLGAMTFDDAHHPENWRAIGDGIWECADATITACDVIPSIDALDTPFVLDADALWSAFEEAADETEATE